MSNLASRESNDSQSITPGVLEFCKDLYARVTSLKGLVGLSVAGILGIAGAELVSRETAHAQKLRINLEGNQGNGGFSLSDITDGIKNAGKTYDEREEVRHAETKEQYFLRLSEEISSATEKLTTAHIFFRQNFALAATDEEKNRLAKNFQVEIVKTCNVIGNCAGLNYLDDPLNDTILSLCNRPMQELKEIAAEDLHPIVSEEAKLDLPPLATRLEKKRAACAASQKKEEGVASL